MSTTATRSLKQVRSIDGILSCVLTHQVASTSAEFKWTGPKFTQEMWWEVLAFFRKVNKDTSSEAQVRLFLNTRERRWAAWAFPQLSGTGMTTKEIEEGSPERDAQRAQFSDEDGWMPYGTIHSHCTAGAFQSSTDEADEQGQDGLHITVGKVNSKEVDVHARFYTAGHKIADPDMSQFWDIEPFMTGVPKLLVTLFGGGARNAIAMKLMAVAAPEDYEFPEQWTRNLIHKEKSSVVTYGQWHPDQQSFGYTTYPHSRNNWLLRTCFKELIELWQDVGLTEDPTRSFAEFMTDVEDLQDEFPLLVKASLIIADNRTDIDEVMKELHDEKSEAVAGALSTFHHTTRRDLFDHSPAAEGDEAEYQWDPSTSTYVPPHNSK